MTDVNRHSRLRSSRVTIRDVAQQAGVSLQTVSRVINHHPDVSDETRERVQSVIDHLRYRPNGIARSLITQSSGTIGVVSSGFQHYGPTQMLVGMEQQATALRRHLLLQVVDSTREDDYERVAGNLISQNVDGVIWAYPELTGEREQSFHQQIQPHLPIVFLSMAPQPGSAVIGVDNRYGARMAVDHLISHGCKHIGLVTGPMELWSSQQRKLGWEDALAGAKLPHSAKLVAEGDWSSASGEAAMDALLKRCPALDGVFSSNDQMALGVLKTAHRLGLRVPQQLAVAGFDNIPESAYFTPALTTVHHDLQELGRLAIRELHRVIEAQRAGAPATATSLTLQPSLVVRDSA